MSASSTTTNTNAAGTFDMSMPDYSSDSSDSSDDDVDVRNEVNVETPPVRYLIPAPYVRSQTEDVDQSEDLKSNETLMMESKQLAVEMAKLKTKLAFYESELSRSQKTLAEVYDPDIAKRRRATFQYGCRTC
jgi:hypothetical protein